MPNMPGRILAVDYGKTRIGLAKSDVTGVLAQSLTVLHRQTDEQAAREIADIAHREEAHLLVVGLPKNMDGSIGPSARNCQQFAELLAETSGLPVEMYDERLTTAAAERTLLEADMSRKKRRGVIDSVAAAVLLQSFLDSRQRHKPAKD